jgi:hypothetical protein
MVDLVSRLIKENNMVITVVLRDANLTQTEEEYKKMVELGGNNETRQTNEGPIDTQTYILRTWPNVANAQLWIDFMLLRPDCVSAEILED